MTTAALDIMASMRTTIVGIDAATTPKRTGLAFGAFHDGRVHVEHAVLGSSVQSMADVIAFKISERPVLLAVDAPLGWPQALGLGLQGHRAGDRLPGDAHDLFRRATDRLVHERLRKLPLEVGADRIARTAHAALRLIDEIRARTAKPVRLVWEPSFEGIGVIEVYPAATLLSRRLSASRYKGVDPATRDSRRAILDALANEWTLTTGPEELTRSDDCLDAALCVLAGADFLRGRCITPTDDQRATAETEGWIWFHPPSPELP